MDGRRFDDLARTLAVRATSRRALLRRLATGAAAGALTLLGTGRASAACRGAGRRCLGDGDCCSGTCDSAAKLCACPGGSVPCQGQCLAPSQYQSDPNNCGACGRRCPLVATGQLACVNGVCGCPAGQKLCNNACIPSGNCCTAAECDDGDACTADDCVANVCQHTAITCPGDADPCTLTTCDRSLGCVTAPIGDAQPCDGQAGVCCAGVCQECCGNDQCDSGAVCCGGTCQPGECCDDVDCGTGSVCCGGTCLTGVCCEDLDCGANQSCCGNDCRAGTYCDGDVCPQGQVCDEQPDGRGFNCCYPAGTDIPDCSSGAHAETCCTGICSSGGPTIRQWCCTDFGGACSAEGECCGTLGCEAGSCCVRTFCSSDEECCPSTPFCVNFDCQATP